MNFIHTLRQPQHFIPLFLLLALVLGGIFYGPIAQFANYHSFADRRDWCGVPNAGDVWSNLAFLIVGLWGWFRLRGLRGEQRLSLAWAGYVLFFTGLALTAFGSAYYHWAPDDARLVWDRLPIALLCAGLVAAAYSEIARVRALPLTILLAVFAVVGVYWWIYTADLRFYLLLQVAPVLLIPIWQHLRRAPLRERLSFVIAIGIYVLARVAEFFDLQIYAALGWISGHTLKHLLAALSSGFIIHAVVERVRAERKDDGLAPLGNRKE